jgi:hypothetical protein
MTTKANEPDKFASRVNETEASDLIVRNGLTDAEWVACQRQIEVVKDRYLIRIEALVGKVTTAFEVNGWVKDGGLSDETDEEYTYGQTLTSLIGVIGIRFSIMEAMQWDGEPVGGLNFRLDIGDDQGRQLDLIPHNFTDQVWVLASDAAAVEERFCELEALNPEELVTELFEQKGWVGRMLASKPATAEERFAELEALDAKELTAAPPKPKSGGKGKKS